jgi:hypothetical protein
MKRHIQADLQRVAIDVRTREAQVVARRTILTQLRRHGHVTVEMELPLTFKKLELEIMKVVREEIADALGAGRSGAANGSSKRHLH